jgi:hypothetical protein
VNTLEEIASHILCLSLGLGFIFLGFVALRSPQKIVDFQFKRHGLLKCYEKISFLKRMYESQTNKIKNGHYAKKWREVWWVLIFMGLFFIYATISDLIK